MASCHPSLIMTKKGLSLEEKRKRMIEYLHQTNDFYQLKELEKMGPKRGIVSQSVKEVVQGLVDDELVSSDKIGTSNYFWAFPSAAVQRARNKEKDLQNKIERETNRHETLRTTMTILNSADRDETPEREQLLQALESEKKRHANIQIQLQLYRESDPDVYREKECKIKIDKEVADKATEDIWTLKSYCIAKFNMDREEFDKMFGIPEDFDTLS
ncbi:meiotic nuclear division protein 1 [Syncephalastrum racemosum]|uniref:Meiotic nuclear division protein 1 n=1 Tax=Syncephalastrum racemosum TaxID=13706 RepID=A0A1X2H2S1_SYNRA|nr:meiotic nuclear division protein 1 [Syncephalastrum racemosum]